MAVALQKIRKFPEAEIVVSQTRLLAEVHRALKIKAINERRTMEYLLNVMLCRELGLDHLIDQITD